MKFSSYYLDAPIKKGRVFDVFEPYENAPERDIALFFIHGGGWRSGSRECFHIIMDELCRRGYICASTDYRLDAKDAFEQLSDIRESFDQFVKILKNRGNQMPENAHLCNLLQSAKLLLLPYRFYPVEPDLPECHRSSGNSETPALFPQKCYPY